MGIEPDLTWFSHTPSAARRIHHVRIPQSQILDLFIWMAGIQSNKSLRLKKYHQPMNRNRILIHCTFLIYKKSRRIKPINTLCQGFHELSWACQGAFFPLAPWQTPPKSSKIFCVQLVSYKDLQEPCTFYDSLGEINMEENDKLYTNFCFGMPFIYLPSMSSISIWSVAWGLKAHGEKAVLRAHEGSCLAALFLIQGQHPEARWRQGHISFRFCTKSRYDGIYDIYVYVYIYITILQ